MSAQSFKNHTRWDPPFHFFAAPILLANPIVLFVWHLRHKEVAPHLFAWLIVASIALLVIAVKSRSNALKVQDRVIRLEEKMRLFALCTPVEMAALDSLTVRQYVALRFASDAELPALAQRAVRESLDPKQIKQSITSWRADNDRV